MIRSRMNAIILNAFLCCQEVRLHPGKYDTLLQVFMRSKVTFYSSMNESIYNFADITFLAIWSMDFMQSNGHEVPYSSGPAPPTTPETTPVRVRPRGCARSPTHAGARRGLRPPNHADAWAGWLGLPTGYVQPWARKPSPIYIYIHTRAWNWVSWASGLSLIYRGG
jgi:hypothetical protein